MHETPDAENATTPDNAAKADNPDELILGLIPPQRFLQGAAMLPAITIAASLGAPTLAIGFASGGLALFFFIVLRALLDRRALPPKVWALAAAQALASGYVFYVHGFNIETMLGV
ncbi:hypothetical protein DV096_17040 [Bradymonadaceae bacterium TMQ3]|nr:hypothetical protein DV096_17040 [Bradymonadaceae bacterium TMQ3]TXC69415.1 hypothetical protein FRC91_17620 [Bradymonadales bacterium TMQ1]